LPESEDVWQFVVIPNVPKQKFPKMSHAMTISLAFEFLRRTTFSPVPFSTHSSRHSRSWKPSFFGDVHEDNIMVTNKQQEGQEKSFGKTQIVAKSSWLNQDMFAMMGRCFLQWAGVFCDSWMSCLS
jgi:hypothetical protein